MTALTCVVLAVLLGVVFWSTDGWLGELIAGFVEEDGASPDAWILFVICAAAIIAYMWLANLAFA